MGRLAFMTALPLAHITPPHTHTQCGVVSTADRINHAISIQHLPTSHLLENNV